MRGPIATTLQAIGIGCLALAGFTVSLGVGFAVAGVGLVAFGLAAERG